MEVIDSSKIHFDAVLAPEGDAMAAEVKAFIGSLFQTTIADLINTMLVEANETIVAAAKAQQSQAVDKLKVMIETLMKRINELM